MNMVSVIIHNVLIVVLVVSFQCLTCGDADGELQGGVGRGDEHDLAGLRGSA